MCRNAVCTLFGSPSLLRLPQGRVKGDDDVAEQPRRIGGRHIVRIHRERQDIGGLVLLSPLGVEAAYVGIVAEDNRQLRWACAAARWLVVAETACSNGAMLCQLSAGLDHIMPNIRANAGLKRAVAW